MERWCDHIKLGEHGTWWITYPGEGSWSLSSCNKFCQLCGTPKPKEKSLEEKFKDYFRESWMGAIPTHKERLAKELNEIAEGHFKPQSLKRE